MSYYISSLTDDELSNFANDAKNVLLDRMASQKDITEEQADYLQRRYVILVTKKGLLGKLWDKIYKNEDGKSYITILLNPITK